MTQLLTSRWNETDTSEHSNIRWQTPFVGIICRNEHSDEELENILEDLRENVIDHGGQFISVDLADLRIGTFSEMFYAALKNTRLERSLQFSLPTILQHNPHMASPFINEAILWQRLCDLLLVDETPYRQTILVLESTDRASPKIMQEIERLIRFHETHSLHRKFVIVKDVESRT